MTPGKNKIKTCLPSEASGKAGAGIELRDGGDCGLKPLPVSRLWNTTILIGTCVHPAGTFQDGWTEGLPCCSVALLIGLDRTDVEHVESKSPARRLGCCSLLRLYEQDFGSLSWVGQHSGTEVYCQECLDRPSPPTCPCQIHRIFRSCMQGAP